MCGKIRGIPAGLTAEVVCPENNNSENITCFQPGCRRQKTARIPGGNTPIWGGKARNPGGDTRFSDGDATDLGGNIPISGRKRLGSRVKVYRIPANMPKTGPGSPFPKASPDIRASGNSRPADTTELCPKTIAEAQPAGLCKKTASAPCKTEAIMIS